VSDSSGSSASESSILDEVGRSLTAEAREGRLDPVLGRGHQIDRLMQVLSRSNRLIPILVGERGVGTSAVVEGFAQEIVRREVPVQLEGKQLYQLDLVALAQTAKDRATFSEQLERVLGEITSRGDIILFIDEIHRPVEVGATEGPVDAISILKPVLARAELQIIGATTPDDYTRYLEKDAAFERRIQRIDVPEPTVGHTIEILKGLRSRYEDYHRVVFTDDALVAAAQLADRYINDRFLPEKAIDLLDEAGSRMRVLRVTTPPDMPEYDEAIARVRLEKEAAIDAQDYEKAAALRDTEKQLLARKTARVKEWQAGDIDVVAEVNEELIEDIVAAATGIPASKLRKLPEAETASFPAVTAAVEPDQVQAFKLLNDQPIADADDDLLGSSGVAAGIASMLMASRGAAPLVVAIDAGWGMGKSTLLRQIEAKLPPRPEVIAVRFNAWTAQGENALEGLIKSVLVELDSRVVRRWARKLGRQRNVMLTGRIGLAVVFRFFGLSRLVDELWDRLAVDAKSRNELRGMIHNMLTDWVNADNADTTRTLVVFIDDLDRCSHDVIIKVCEAVKLYLDAPGLIFVIACDMSVLAHGVSRSVPDEASQGRNYLEKIIQVAYRLPPPEEAKTRQLIRGYARLSGATRLIDDTVTELIVTLAGHNPRRIKRIINSLVLEDQLNHAWRQAPLDSAQLARAVLLQHLYAPFYDLLIANGSGEDPIIDFLDYADVCARAADPPASGHAWWSIASRTFQRRGMPAPERSPGTGERLTAELKQLEAGISQELQSLARDTSFIALLRGVGGKETRRALHALLITRPLGAGLLPGQETTQIKACMFTVAGTKPALIRTEPGLLSCRMACA
jgi:hypothetical protein